MDDDLEKVYKIAFIENGKISARYLEMAHKLEAIRCAIAQRDLKNLEEAYEQFKQRVKNKGK